MRYLEKEENMELMRAPVYLCLMAVRHDGQIQQRDKKKLRKLALKNLHSANPKVQRYFKRAGILFENNMEAIVCELPFQNSTRKYLLYLRLTKLKPILHKISNRPQRELRLKLNDFYKKAQKSAPTIFERIEDAFFGPMPELYPEKIF